MPTFDTPQPIVVAVQLIAARVRITAGDRRETTVDVAPSDPADRADVRAAAQTTVEMSGRTLAVATPKQWRSNGVFGGSGSISVTIELPAGSQLHGQLGVGELHAEGRLGDCRLKAGAGSISLGQVDAAHLSTGAGDITVDQAATLELAGAGTMRVGQVTSKCAVRNVNGDTWIGDAGGHVRCAGSNGDVTIERAGASVVAKTANGSIRIGEATDGSVTLETARGDLDVGIPEGTAAMLDARTRFGSVRNSLSPADGPGSGDRTVQVRARTSLGDITIRRSAAMPTS